jgi:hypothetical protein
MPNHQMYCVHFTSQPDVFDMFFVHKHALVYHLGLLFRSSSVLAIVCTMCWIQHGARISHEDEDAWTAWNGRNRC